MSIAAGVSIAIICMIFGLVTAVRPTLISEYQEDAETSPERAVRLVRIGAILMFLFGAAMLYAVLTADGPPEFIGV
jgi:hypothetical protein